VKSPACLALHLNFATQEFDTVFDIARGRGVNEKIIMNRILSICNLEVAGSGFNNL
jgi:hypothetical protein